METEEPLLILGASARAAAFSALRAGLRPWCVDLFGDLDLRPRCPVSVLAADNYPAGLVALAARGPAGPWIYTGALENRRPLVRRLARLRPLWGNDAAVLAAVRSPRRVAAILAAAGLPCPAVRDPAVPAQDAGRWLMKPRTGAAGAGIRFWEDGPIPPRRVRRVYLQEFIEGESCAALFLGKAGTAALLGVTRQLVGAAWLGAGPFHYCGSIGPLGVTGRTRRILEAMGTALAAAAGMRGLFGIDFVLRDEVPWPVEVNPRYTASVEVLEYATGLRTLSLHQGVFVPTAPVRDPVPVAPGAVGKAVLFARAPLRFPEEGPWLASLHAPAPVAEMPAFADIPAAGQSIAAGRPILTFFTGAANGAECLNALHRTAVDLDASLYPRLANNEERFE